ncbi:MAG TPA: hypothetical protein VFB59_03635 [Candidatus Saccharimonadales bacterium]|nr:hypothetical protein [Candidatus Saccharimonadales bacterium]
MINQCTNPFKGIGEYGAYYVPPPADVIRVQKGHQLLSVVRTDHILYNRDEQYAVMLGAWLDFWDTTNSNPDDREIHGEGDLLWAPEVQYPHTAINWIGDRALLGWFSEKYSVPWYTADPEGPKEFIELLQQGFEPDAIMYYLTLRHVVQYHRSLYEQRNANYNIRLHMQGVLQKFIDRYQGIDNWRHFSFEAAHRKFFGDSAKNDMYDPFFATEQTASFYLTDTAIQQVAVAWSIERNNFFMTTLADRLAKGKSLFAARGWQHGYVLEDKIRALGDSSSIEQPYASLTYHRHFTHARQNCDLLRKLGPLN